MSKLLKYKNLFIALMVALAIVTVASAITVSYAKWASSGDSFSANGKTGTWAEINASYTIEFDDGTTEAFGKNELTGKYLALFNTEENEIKNFNIEGRTAGFTDVINTYEENSEVKDCISAGETDYKYKTNGAGTYTVEINTDTRTITFTFVKPEAASYVIEFSDGISAVFNKHDTEANKYTAVFGVSIDKSLRVLKNENIAEFSDANSALNGCVTGTGAAAGFTYKTAKGAGIYTVVIEGDKITFTCEQSSGNDITDFTNAVNSPGPMRDKIGSTYGIITSNLEVIRFDTVAKRSNYFTLKSSKLFSILINNVRVNNSYYSDLTLPAEGIDQDTGGKSHLFTVNREGTYYVTYELNGSRPKNIEIKCIDRVEFAGATETTSNGVKKSSSSLIRTEADGTVSYNTTFTLTEASNKDFNVYINDEQHNPEIAEESKQYLTKNESGDYGFTFKATGTFSVTVKDNVLTVTSDNAGIINKVASVTVGGETSVTEGQTINLTATVLGEDGNLITDKQVIWNTDDISVATVNGNGVLTGVGAGTVNVTATVDGVASDAFAVTVVKEKVASVTVSVADGAEAKVEAGKTLALIAAVTGEFNNTLNGITVVWSVDVGAVASISQDGVLTGISAGTVNVTATADGVSSEVFTVTVTEPVVSPEIPTLQITASAIESGKELKDSTGSISVTIASVSSKNTNDSIIVGDKTYTGRVQINTAGISFNLSENYTYKIKIVAASSGSGARTFTLDGDTNKTKVTNASSTEYIELCWTEVTYGQHALTVSGNARIAYIEVIATPV